MVDIIHFKPEHFELLHELNNVFAVAFDDYANYAANPPSDEYLIRLLENQSFVALAAIINNKIIGGLVAYHLTKFEQRRSETYIYDLAVLPDFRRKGIATSLISKLKPLAAAQNSYVIFVQADTSPDDQAAIALYDKLGTREEVLHFDIEVSSPRRSHIKFNKQP